MTGADGLCWPVFPMVGWGIGVVMNAWDVIGTASSTRPGYRARCNACRSGEYPGWVRETSDMSKQSRSRPARGRLPGPVYKRELYRLQAELVTMQEWVRASGARVVAIFEGRDAAVKGSTIKRVTEYLNPRIARIVALPSPSERGCTPR